MRNYEKTSWRTFDTTIMIIVTMMIIQKITVMMTVMMMMMMELRELMQGTLDAPSILQLLHHCPLRLPASASLLQPRQF